MISPRLLFFAAASLAWAGDTDVRSHLSGVWQPADASAGSASIEFAGNDDKLRIVESDSGRKTSEIECGTLGKECELKIAGKPAKVSLWFSGPKLVVLETRGSDIVKRRYTTSESGQELSVEVIPVVPPGKAETHRYKRASSQ